MSDAAIKTAAFLAIPFLVIPFLFFAAVACVLMWVCIPFARVVRNGKKFTLRWD